MTLEEEITRLEATMRRYDASDPETIDSEEYARILDRLVTLRKVRDAQDETAWLIERARSTSHSPTLWWCGGDEHWTTDAMLARRFSTKGDADKLARTLFASEAYAVTEHTFMNRPATRVGD